MFKSFLLKNLEESGTKVVIKAIETDMQDEQENAS
jgi:hypothetical protein